MYRQSVFIFLVLSIFQSGLSNAETAMTRFSPKVTAAKSSVQYNVDELGGYRIQVDPKWENVNNTNVQNAVNILVFSLKRDRTVSLTLTITKLPLSRKPEALMARERLEKSLLKKGIKPIELTSKSVKINGFPAEISSALIGEGREIASIVTQQNQMTLTATLGSKDNDDLSEGELIDLLSSFKILG